MWSKDRQQVNQTEGDGLPRLIDASIEQRLTVAVWSNSTKELLANSISFYIVWMDGYMYCVSVKMGPSSNMRRRQTGGDSLMLSYKCSGINRSRHSWMFL